MNPLVAQLLPLLPKDFNTRMAILQQLNTTIVQEEFAKQSLQHSQREMVTAQRHADLQQSNGQLLAENNRLKSELHKLDLIRTNVQDITSSSFSNNTTPLDLSELARAPSTSSSAPHLLQQQPRQGQQQQQQQQQHNQGYQQQQQPQQQHAEPAVNNGRGMDHPTEPWIPHTLEEHMLGQSGGTGGGGGSVHSGVGSHAGSVHSHQAGMGHHNLQSPVPQGYYPQQNMQIHPSPDHSHDGSHQGQGQGGAMPQQSPARNIQQGHRD